VRDDETFGWRTGEFLPIKKKYKEVAGRMQDTGEWDWAVPRVLSDIPEQIDTAASYNPAKQPEGMTDEQIGSMLSLSGFGASPIRGTTLTSTPIATTAARPRHIEMYHGTDSPVPFDELKPGMAMDAGISLTTNPNFAGTWAGPEGGRIYPVLADPGPNPFKPEWGMVDAMNWNKPERSAKSIREWYNGEWGEPAKPIPPQLEELLQDWEKGTPVLESLKKRGYSSMAFESGDVSDLSGKPEPAWLFPDAENIVPKFSPEGQSILRRQAEADRLKKKRGR
jgi:hypothetical protein